MKRSGAGRLPNAASCDGALGDYRSNMDAPHGERETEPPPRDRMGCAVLLAASVGCVTMPAGGFVLLAWSALVSLVMVVGAARDGHRVSRLAIAGLVACLWTTGRSPT
jgi:hypothetical protein